MSKWQTLTTVPDVATASLLREVLVEGGIEDVDVRSRAGVAYMPRAVAIDFDVRVHPEDFSRAQLVMRDYEEEIGLAAIREAGVEPPPPQPSEPPQRTDPQSNRWLLWVAAGVALALLFYRR